MSDSPTDGTPRPAAPPKPAADRRAATPTPYPAGRNPKTAGPAHTSGTTHTSGAPRTGEAPRTADAPRATGTATAAPAAPAVATAPAVTPWARYALLYAFLFLMGAETFLLSPLLPTIASDLRVGTGGAAQVVTAYVLAYAVAAPLLGGVSDRFPRRVFIAGGALLFLVGNLLCARSGSLPELIAARALTGLGGAMAAPAMWAHLAETAAPHQRGRAVAGGVSCYALGQVLGVPLGGLLAEAVSWPWVFVAVAAGLVPLVPLIAWRLKGPRPARSGSPLSAFGVWRDRRVALPLLSTGLLQAGRLGAYTFVGTLFAYRFSFDTGQLGLLGLMVGAGSLTGSLASGRAIDRARARGLDENWLSAGCSVLFVAAAVTTLTSRHLTLALIALFVWFVAGGAFYTVQQTYLGGVRPDRRAGIVSWNGTLDHLGVALGTTLLGPWLLAGPAFVALTAGLGLAACALSVLAARSGTAYRSGRRRL
ncbi:MFS transporter [Streptomyces sp. URMC 123]|uniref:MFS transporter n=1 Tax=Streptomyces sp. URMC 123 TaxID=3423403 RepID=UPI003F1D3373